MKLFIILTAFSVVTQQVPADGYQRSEQYKIIKQANDSLRKIKEAK